MDMAKHLKIPTPLIDYTSILQKYQKHPLVQGRFYFLLPTALLKEVARAMGEANMDPDQLAMDIELGKLMEDDPGLVALYCGELDLDRPSATAAGPLPGA